VDEPKEIIPAIKRALRATESGRPALIEFMTKEETAVPMWW
jgi:thiamine pyrophosphate-dependent acetolactate synthase large subunit-like protein